jgi:hypothetical protein
MGKAPWLTRGHVIWTVALAAALLLFFGLIWPATKNCAELGGEQAVRYVSAFRDACGGKCCPEVARRFNAEKPYSGPWAWLMNKNDRVYVGDISKDGVCNYVVSFHGRFPCHDFDMSWDSRKPGEFSCERCGCGDLFEAAGFTVNYSQ